MSFKISKNINRIMNNIYIAQKGKLEKNTVKKRKLLIMYIIHTIYYFHLLLYILCIIYFLLYTISIMHTIEPIQNSNA